MRTRAATPSAARSSGLTSSEDPVTTAQGSRRRPGFSRIPHRRVKPSIPGIRRSVGARPKGSSRSSPSSRWVRAEKPSPARVTWRQPRSFRTSPRSARNVRPIERLRAFDVIEESRERFAGMYTRMRPPPFSSSNFGESISLLSMRQSQARTSPPSHRARRVQDAVRPAGGR